MIILDTNVLSELMRSTPSSPVVAWIRKQRTSDLFTTSITEVEIFYGIELLARGKRRDGLRAAAEAMFAEDLAGRIIPFESDAARVFSRIAAHRRAVAKPISHSDAQMAAIVQLRAAQLATRNTGDFEHCGIDVLNPWRPL